MKASALKYAVVSSVATMVTIILVLMPFHAFLTVWAADMFGHYTAFRLWKEVLLALAGLGVVYLMLTDHKIRTHTLSRRLVWLIFGYAAMLLCIGVAAYARGAVTPTALAYGLLIDLRFLVFFLIAWAVALRTARLQANWYKLVMVPAAVVVVFGILQITVLPTDFLKHFGYGSGTIEAVETVDQNENYVRIMSTLRGPNPLGAYLILPLTVLALTFLIGRRKIKVAGLAALTAVVLFVSYSRSAYIGTVASILALLTAQLHSARAKRLLAGSCAALMVIAAGVTLVLQNNTTFQNVILHTQDGSESDVSSNDARIVALQDGIGDIAREPFGAGPGSAGPASVYNDGQANISENYFIQIGQEAGIVGMGLFIVINAGVGYLLWLRRRSPLALSLFASLIGISVVNMFVHAWADDTLAYVWWGLAGIAMATLPLERDEKTA